MKITESQLRKIVRQEILREAGLRTEVMEAEEPTLVDLVGFAEDNELFERPFDDGYAMDLIDSYLGGFPLGMDYTESWKSSALAHLEAQHDLACNPTFRR